MKAAYIKRYGKIEDVQLVPETDAALPTAG